MATQETDQEAQKHDAIEAVAGFLILATLAIIGWGVHELSIATELD
ncbi:MAG: hypothetical protein ACE5F4_00425 [Candidatus Paceibacteria bacterium]